MTSGIALAFAIVRNHSANGLAVVSGDGRWELAVVAVCRIGKPHVANAFAGQLFGDDNHL